VEPMWWRRAVSRLSSPAKGEPEKAFEGTTEFDGTSVKRMAARESKPRAKPSDCG
jgi:hypothetical protein